MPDVLADNTGFHWGISGLDRNRFHAAAKFQYLRFGRQVESPTQYRDSIVSGWDSSSDDGVTVGAFDAAGCELNQLKHAFLDRLAEFMSHSTGGCNVCAAGMVEKVGQVRILVAKNNFMDEKSVKMLRYLEKTLRQLSTLDPQGQF